MATPERKEQHVVTCALCKEGSVEPSLEALARWGGQHMRMRHNKSTAYLSNATRSVTVLYETDDPDKDQPPGVIDPTTQFLHMITRMKEKGLQ